MHRVLAALLLGSLVIAGCGDSTSDYESAETGSSDMDYAPTSTAEVYGVGDTQIVTQDDSQGHSGERQRVTLLDTKRVRRKRCDSYGYNCVTAGQGNRMLGVKLSIEGLDGNIEECGGNSATLLTKAGDQSEPVSYDPYLTPQLNCFNRRRGQKITGWVTMEIDRSASDVLVSWRPANGNNAEDLQWTLR